MIFEKYNVHLILFSNLFADIQLQIVNDTLKHDLLVNNKLNLKYVDSKKLIYHNTIYYLCNYLTNYKSNKHIKLILVFDEFDYLKQDYEIFTYCNKDTLNNILKKLFTKLKNVLPICIVLASKPLCDLNENSGECQDFIHFVKNQCEKQNYRIENFKMVKKFAKDNDLTFLFKQFFNTMQAKSLFLK